MKLKFAFIFVICAGLVACLEFKSSVFDAETDMGSAWNRHFRIPNYNLAGGDVVRFALITDSHQNYKDLDDTVNIVNESGAQFVIHLGDFTDSGTRDEYEIFFAFWRDLLIPSWVVPGNHDLATTRDKLFRRVFGADNQSIVTPFAKFIFWNSNALELVPTRADLNWLQQEVASASATEPVLIFQHQDPFNNLTFTPVDRAQMTTIMSAHPQIFVFHGHLHRFSRSQVGNAEFFQIHRVEGRKWAYVEIDATNLRVYYCSKRSCDEVYENAVISPLSVPSVR
ncbi:MAG: metallophosphoesterase family protein [Bdellovibrionales bacterium]